MNFGVDLFWPAYLAAMLALGAVAAHVLAYRRTSRPVGAGTRRLLLAIRLAAIGLLVFALWRPAVESQETLSRRARLVLLVDTSKSMSIGDEERGSPRTPCSRLARAGDIFSTSSDLWRRICESYEVSASSFSSVQAPLGVSPEALATNGLAGLRADGPVTALGDAVQEASRGATAPEAILMISDGLSNSGIDPLDAAIPGGAAVFAVGVGKDRPTESTRDVAASGIFAPPEAFESSEVTVIGNFRATGFEGRAVRVHFFANGKEVASKEANVNSREALVEARFTWKPEKAGPARLEVAAEPQAGEIIAANNSARTYVDVKKGQLKVLYLEGTFRWEAKFVRLALESARDIDLRLVVPGGDGADLPAVVADNWDVLIVGDLAASRIPKGTLASIADKVAEEGKGILFLGGADSFGAGGYAATPLASLVPFGMSPGDKLVNGLYRVSARPEGPYEGIIALGPERTLDEWEALPPVLAANQVGPPRPGASVLLEGLPVVLDETTGKTSQDGSRAPLPVLAVQDYGKGRSAAVTADGTWQWATGAGISGSTERDAAAGTHRRLWRQLVFWLAKREERGGITLQLALSSHRVEVGRSVEMEAKLLDSDLVPLADATLVAETASDAKDYRTTFRREGDSYRGEFKAPAAGDYTVKVEASRGGNPVAEAESAFVAAAADVEFTTLVARPAILEALARATGGAFAPADGAAEVLSQIQSLARLTRYATLKRSELWSSWWYLSAIVGLLGLEWTLRKVSGLV